MSDHIADKTVFHLSRINEPQTQVDATVYKSATTDDKTQFINRSLPSDFNKAEPSNRAHSNPAILKDRFVLEELLGSGGMGIVYKAKDLLKVEAQDKDPYVAIKVLTDEFKRHPDAFISLQRESRKTQRLAHPNIVTVFDFDRDKDSVFMTMEYLDGIPLDKLIGQYRSIGLPKSEAMKIIFGICSALSYAHQKNIIHSDLKPGNIFVDHSGTAKVIDFGIARAVSNIDLSNNQTDETLFDPGNLGALTPTYASLEMLEGGTPDPTDDIYALGCIAYELLCGEHPFGRAQATDAKSRKLKPKKSSKLSKNEWKAIQAALQFDRSRRISSVDEFVKKLKKRSNLKLTSLVLIGFFSIAYGSYYIYQERLMRSDFDIARLSEIERRLKSEILENRYLELFRRQSFTKEWNNELFTVVNEISILKNNDEKWKSQEYLLILKSYENKIVSLFKDSKLDEARELIEMASIFDSTGFLNNLSTQLDELLEQYKVHKSQNSTKSNVEPAKASLSKDTIDNNIQKTDEYSIAKENLSRILSCNTMPDMESVSVSVKKLSTLDKNRYASEIPLITQKLAECIKKVSFASDLRANTLLSKANELFPNNSTLLNLKFEKVETCKRELAGLGSRGISSGCKDQSQKIVNTPNLVIIPGNQSFKGFAIARYELSQLEINEFCKETNKCKSNNPSDEPANFTTPELAREYVVWLSQNTGQKYRIPTLSEWRYAATAQENLLDPNRNCQLNSRGIVRGNGFTSVRTGKQNKWGLINHIGNIGELVVNNDGSMAIAGGDYLTEMSVCDHNRLIEQKNRTENLIGLRVLREIRE